jgi:hypothetical protein
MSLRKTTSFLSSIKKKAQIKLKRKGSYSGSEMKFSEEDIIHEGMLWKEGQGIKSWKCNLI